jgi:hypothetical protein
VADDAWIAADHGDFLDLGLCDAQAVEWIAQRL